MPTPSDKSLAAAPACLIPLSEPELSGLEWQYVKDCLDSGWVSSVGSFVDRFESDLAGHVGTQHAVATSSGTAALHVALVAAGVQADDEVLVSTLTFIAPANAVRYVGAWPVFIDAEAEFWQMDPQKVTDFLEQECQWVNRELRNKTTGRRVKAVLPVHILGHPVDFDPIMTVAKKFDLAVIEDATESLGTKYKGRMVGHLGDIACFSFNGNKIITTGGGGMVVTDNEAWARKVRYLTTQAKDDAVEFIHQEIGYNYRLSNIQAALGCAQLEHLNRHISAKRKIAACYAEELSSVGGLGHMQEAPWAFSTFWLSALLVDPNRYGKDRRMLLKELELAKIQTRPLWQPMHRSPAHLHCQAYHCDRADWLHERVLCLPSSVGLTEAQQRWIIDRLHLIGMAS